MNKKKDEELRKKAKSSLDPKGWEALLEGVPRVDEPETPAAEDTAAERPGAQDRHLLRVRDEAGRVSETVTSPGPAPAPEPEPDTRTQPPAASPDAQLHTPTERKPSRPAGAKKGVPALLAPLRKHPGVQKVLQYYRGLNTREQRVLLAGLVFLGTIFLHTFVLAPLMEKNQILNRKIQKKQEELAEMRRLRSSIDRDRGGLDRIQTIIRQRPPDFSVFAYLEQLAAKAEMKDRIVYIKPQRETPVGPFRESLAEIKLDHIPLDELSAFLYRIESSEDLLYVKTLRIKSRTAGKEAQGLEVTLSVGTLLQGRS